MSLNPSVRIEVPQIVHIHDGQPGEIVVTVTLVNPNNDPVEVTAPTPQDIHYWEIADAEGATIVHEPLEPKMPTEQMLLLQGGETKTEMVTVSFDGSGLHDDGEYIMRYRYWMHEGTAHFIVKRGNDQNVVPIV